MPPLTAKQRAKLAGLSGPAKRRRRAAMIGRNTASPDGPGGATPPPGGLDGIPNRRPQGFQKWWGNQMENRAGFVPSFPAGDFRPIARQLWKEGARGKDFRGLFSPGVENLFASNYAGGQGQPSPYLDYFQNNPQALLQLLSTQGIRNYTGGSQAQQDLFAQFPGLRESYLGSLGRVEVRHPGGGTLVFDPNDPRQAASMNAILRAGGQVISGGTPAAPGVPLDPTPASPAPGMSPPLPAAGAAPVWGSTFGQAQPQVQQGLGAGQVGPGAPQVPQQQAPPPAQGAPVAPSIPHGPAAGQQQLAAQRGLQGQGAGPGTQTGQPLPAAAPGVAGQPGAASAMPDYLAQAQQAIAAGQQGIGVPLSGAYEAGTRSLEDQLQAMLAQIQAQRGQVGPMTDLQNARLGTDQQAAQRALDEQMVSRGIYNSGIRTQDTGTLGTDFARARQDVGMQAAQQYGQLDMAAAEAYGEFQRELQELLLNLAGLQAQNPSPAVGRSEPTPIRPKRRRKPPKGKK
jgi:hypothetical protein